jgi:hypothetical protein
VANRIRNVLLGTRERKTERQTDILYGRLQHFSRHIENSLTSAENYIGKSVAFGFEKNPRYLFLFTLITVYCKQKMRSMKCDSGSKTNEGLETEDWRFVSIRSWSLRGRMMTCTVSNCAALLSDTGYNGLEWNRKSRKNANTKRRNNLIGECDRDYIEVWIFRNKLR